MKAWMAGAALLAGMAAPALAQDVRIDSGGIRAGGTVIDSHGVHTPGATIDSSGVRTHHGRGTRAHPSGTNGNGGSAVRDCAGGATTVSGNRNTLTLTRCSGVTVAGNDNHLVVSLTGKASVSLVGNRNTLAYSVAQGGAPAQISDVGTGNRITRR